MRMRSPGPDASSVTTPPSEPEWATPAMDAGYRPLRRLPDDVGGYLARGRDDEPVLVEVIGADDGGEQNRLARALAALDRLEHPHVQRVVDVGDGQGASIVLVTSPAPVRSLAALLARRRRLAAGEVVTLLAPLCTALRHCHDRGVVHGSIAAMSVGLTEAGLPFLRGFESAILIEGRRDRRALIVADVDAFAELAERCWPTDSGAAWRDAGGLQGIERMLFELADPEPIRADDPVGAPEREPDLRAVLTERAAPTARRAAPTPVPSRRSHRGEPDAGRIERVLRLVDRRRGPVVVGLSVAVAGAIALTTLPNASAGDAAPSAPTARPAAAASPAVSATAPASVPAPIASVPAPSTAPNAPELAETSPSAAPIDAATAAAALVAALRACDDDECAATFLTEDSPLRDAGPEAWAALASADPAALTVSDENGDAAVIGFVPSPADGSGVTDEAGETGETATASALMLRTEAGWLLRDVFDAG
ncbi:hypothetical protein HQQ81_09345 [Microbacteriaceae bacterium VKM Ac-2854]|nr:hypothetical protein [Microbacteriaceae bacterium VKM Ac-2854]